MNLYEFSAGTFSFSSRIRIENSIPKIYREVMRAFRRKPLFVQRKSILILTLEVRKLHMDKITSQARTNLSIAVEILIGSMSDRETEKKSDIYICNIYT